MSSLIAIHIDPSSKKIVGVWLDIKGVPTSYYTGSQYQQQLGQSYMASQIRGTWNDWVTRLTQRTPIDIWWEATKSLSGETPQEAFERVTSKNLN